VFDMSACVAVLACNAALGFLLLWLAMILLGIVLRAACVIGGLQIQILLLHAAILLDLCGMRGSLLTFAAALTRAAPIRVAWAILPAILSVCHDYAPLGDMVIRRSDRVGVALPRAA